MSSRYTTFHNARLCKGGELVRQTLVVSNETGKFVERTDDNTIGSNAIDCEGAAIAPGFTELQTNGCRGFHFTHLQDQDSYTQKLNEVAAYLPTTGVTSFYATVPTVASEEFKKILPFLAPREIPGSASLLGAHAEGPYLHPSKKGAHNATLFHPASVSPSEAYGKSAENGNVLRLVTLAPELEDAPSLIKRLTSRDIRVSLGHSNANYTQGLTALNAGATCLTHTLNAMAPLHHREPGLAGLVTIAAPPSMPQNPYFSIIPDGHHLHPSVATMLFRSSPSRCIFITDSIELAGLPDGTYPGHAQIPGNQTKEGSRVVIEGTETLIGGCASLQECVQNVIRWSDCSIAEAVRCVSENISHLMGDTTRGTLEAGKRADFVFLDDEANILQTWIAGRKVYDSG